MDTRYRILAVQVGLVAPYLYPPLVKRNSEISESICSNWAKINHWLVVYLPLWKWWSSSVGMIIPFPTVSGKSFKIPWFQTTNQTINFPFLLVKLSCILYNKNDPLPGPAILSRMAKPRSQKPAWKNPMETSNLEQHMENSMKTWRNPCNISKLHDQHGEIDRINLDENGSF